MARARRQAELMPRGSGQPVVLESWDDRSGAESGSRARPTDPPQPDAELTRLAMAARARESGAVRPFLEAIAPAVRGVCRGVLGADHIELDDTVQECLLDILRALSAYRSEGPILHYAKRIALRGAIAARKRGRHRARRLRDFADATSVQDRIVPATELPGSRLVREVIDSLPLVQAEAILMRAILGFSVEEIATVSKVPINTAKSRLRVAKQSLRDQLERALGLGKAVHDR